MLICSCKNEQKHVDLILHHAKIYTVDSSFTIKEAIAIDKGKIIAVGSNDEIISKYTSNRSVDASGKFIYPGFIDAHCHFYGYGKGLNELDLIGTRSFNEVIEKSIEYAKQQDLYPEKTEIKLNQNTWIVGRGWDQNDWDKKEFPHKFKLDSLFPNTPVILKRIDGHAVLVNTKALEIAGFNSSTKISGGELEKINGKLTGILIDNAVDAIEKFVAAPGQALIEKALLKAQTNCLAMGLTTVDDAGLEKVVIDAIDRLQKSNELKIRIYAMLTPNAENLIHYLKNGIYKTDKLNVCSFKFYGDGALGSRGACLKEDYSDRKNWKGFLLNDLKYFANHAEMISKSPFQMNTHCIGDSAAKAIISIYKKHCTKGSNKRWRIEHAQVIDQNNFKDFSMEIIPSVQPTHATSDMYWAGERLGNERIKDAYAYNKLLKNAGMLALGTDFPVEDISPFKTFYAAVARKDAKGFPEKGFQKENALSRENTLKGMTIWAAYSNFEENEKGSLEKGKWADFVILDQDIMQCKEELILNSKVLSTYIAGEEVYKK